MRKQLCECEDCQVAMMDWFEMLHDADVLAARDVITEAAWRAEFAAWVEGQA